MRRAHTPDGVALSYLDDELTYRELDERSSKLARELIDRGIGPEKVVALGMTRSVESVVAMLAVSKAGAAFVPVDPTYPNERVRFMLTDSGAVLGLTVVAELHRLPDSVPWSAIDDAEFRGRLARLSVRSISDVDRVHPIRPDNPAYVIYTSGSTGLPPKGGDGLASWTGSACCRTAFAVRCDPGCANVALLDPEFRRLDFRVPAGFRCRSDHGDCAEHDLRR